MTAMSYTGPLDPEKHELANRVIVAFRAELENRGLLVGAALDNSSADDRFLYRIFRYGRSDGVMMRVPGVPLEQLQSDAQASPGFELWIDDIGLSWSAALDLVAERLGPLDDMENLRLALKLGRRVEIRVNIPGVSPRTDTAAREAGREAVAANERGERIAHVIEDGQSVDQCEVTAEQADELMRLGAVDPYGEDDER